MNASGDPVIEHVAETGSTNSDLLARVLAAAASGAASFAPRLLVAERQNAGRGRHGRRWHAAAGASLTFSLAWPVRRNALSGLSLAIGVALADALEPAPGRRIGLKWPNDLWLREDDADRPGRKLAGVLVETATFGNGRVVVIGIGLNVHAQPGLLDAASGVAGLDEIDTGATPESALGCIAPALVAALREFDEAGFAAFADRFVARDLLRGRRVVGDAAIDGLEGIAVGVAADGALLLQTAAGVRPIASGEWRLRLAETARTPY